MLVSLCQCAKETHASETGRIVMCETMRCGAVRCQRQGEFIKQKLQQQRQQQQPEIETKTTFAF